MVNWWKIIWFSKTALRWAFIAWLAMKDRLSTKERLANWGITNDILCPLLVCCGE